MPLRAFQLRYKIGILYTLHVQIGCFGGSREVLPGLRFFIQLSLQYRQNLLYCKGTRTISYYFVTLFY